MNFRAVIFDLYHTLLEIGPPPADADEHWPGLWRKYFGSDARRSEKEFRARAETVIAREHARALGAGVAYPEIYWPDVASEVIPELARLPAAERDDFLRAHAALQRTTRLAPDAGEVLNELHRRGRLLGIASNSQPYSLSELDAALATAALSRAIFTADLCFFSFEHGFSKPDPHVFRLLAARLAARGITPAETLMVGDRLDNDIAPAQAQGWRTWQLTIADPHSTGRAGSWRELLAWLT